ncbi:DUF402 domain-containing protein [Pyxidicoccus fallax]|uniref:DUF402 domain-containing protein n=1 Tax=Pyxidicoccus fallax TaxID=394095 RepID=A0A848LJA9_9BACT|nr:DUF402 domain-containing protein [Pyxidicoccus fallax]NMO17809.1 DUF402 domain-containing protein [Pyxidicoccus fallax]NPC79849.1 DUF402 domain-containing protein [Pyxidicoccus fallax]
MSLFVPGEPVIVHHDKPWKPGRRVRMRGHVLSFDGERLVMGRRFRSPGLAYDGLPAVQQAGDHGTIELVRGAWICRRRYLRADGTLIGELYNVQTPIRFRRGMAQYVDLEIDVARVPGAPKPVRIIDVEDLEAAVAGGHIPRPVADVAHELATRLAARLRDWDGREPLDWDVRPETAPSLRELPLARQR